MGRLPKAPVRWEKPRQSEWGGHMQYDETTYGRRIAAAYDDIYPDVDDSMVDRLAE